MMKSGWLFVLLIGLLAGSWIFLKYPREYIVKVEVKDGIGYKGHIGYSMSGEKIVQETDPHKWVLNESETKAFDRIYRRRKRVSSLNSLIYSNNFPEYWIDIYFDSGRHSEGWISPAYLWLEDGSSAYTFEKEGLLYAVVKNSSF